MTKENTSEYQLNRFLVELEYEDKKDAEERLLEIFTYLLNGTK